MYRYIRVAMVDIRDSDMIYVGGVVELVGKCVYPCGSAGRVLRQKNVRGSASNSLAELAKQGLAELASQRAISIQVFGELAELAPLVELVEGS